jgi:hypothetical protein
MTAPTRTHFQVPGPFGPDVPFTHMHVWSWAQAQPVEELGGLRTVMQYLDSLGFHPERHNLPAEDLATLHHALVHYTRMAPRVADVWPLDKALPPLPEGQDGFYLYGRPGRYALAPELAAALTAAGWVYDVDPSTTYFRVHGDVLCAYYQQILGSRMLARVTE